VTAAVDHLAERKASFRALDLDNHALRHAAGRPPLLEIGHRAPPPLCQECATKPYHGFSRSI
jgi:hypothetical protein